MNDPLAFIATIRWQDVVDILVNSYILYRVYVLFHGTNAFRVLAAVTSLWILQEIAASVGLILTSWGIRGITAAAAIIIIVVFRNEIRTVLLARNVKAFLWGSPTPELSSPVDTITEALFQMAQKRIGALVVFPGKEDLSEVLHGGIAWDGTISNEMLISIFWPKNPVHDGAIIIRESRVVEVGVLLPLSQRQDLPSFYGTRHRAAAGLAERTDALVVAVSEERGRVTVARNNELKPVADRKEFAQVLRKHLNLEEETQEARKRRERNRHIVASVLSILIMTAIWFGFTRSQDTIIGLSVPIEYVNRPAGFEILETSIDEARLQLYGSSALIKSLRQGQVQVKVDLSKATEGKNVFSLTQDDILLPPGVFLNRIQPPTLDVTLDVPSTREIPIQVDWVGKLPENYAIVKAMVSPDSVKVIGGSKILDKVQTIYTSPIKVDGVTKSGILTGTIVLSPPSLKLSSGATDRVSVSFIVEERSNNSDRKQP